MLPWHYNAFCRHAAYECGRLVDRGPERDENILYAVLDIGKRLQQVGCVEHYIPKQRKYHNGTESTVPHTSDLNRFYLRDITMPHWQK